MSAWQDAPDASGLWWVRREDHRDVVVQVDVSPEGVWINRGGEGWCSVAEYDGVRWCRVVTPERVEALETEVGTLRAELASVRRSRETLDAVIDRARAELDSVRHAAVLRGATVAGERGSRG